MAQKELKDMTVAEANASGQGQAYSNLVAGYGAGVPSTLPSPTITSTVTPNIAEVSGTKPIVLPNTKPTPVTSGNLGGNVDSTMAGLNADLSTPPEDPNVKAVKDSLKNYLDTTGQEDITAAKEEEIRTKNIKTKANNELTQIDKNYKDEVNEIKKNSEGMFGGALQSKLNDAYDKYNDRRANAAINYNMTLADYQTAQETVALKSQSYKDKKDAQYREWEMNAKMAYEYATPEQKLALAKKQAEMEANVSLLSGAKETVLNNLLQNNAPQSVWNAVDTAASLPGATASSIMSAAGSYGAEKKDTGAKTEQLKLDDGTIQLINSETGAVIATYGKGTDTTKSSAQLGLVNDINNVLADPNIDSVFGLTSYFNRTIPGTSEYTLSSQVNNIIQQAALAARGQLKGQGAVSDFEGKMLKEAQTALKLNMNTEDAKKALIKLKGAIITSSGGSTQVLITSKDGTSKLGLADQKTITDAISSGYRVEYQ